jgi:hypothetical protein
MDVMTHSAWPKFHTPGSHTRVELVEFVVRQDLDDRWTV